MSLHDLRGHETVREALIRAVARGPGAGALPASIMLHGPPGVGKQRTALWIAQLLLCTDRSPEGPCGACHDCRLALRLEHPDVHWHFPLARPRGASTPEKLADALEEARFARLVELREEPLQPTWTEEPRAHYLAAARTLRRRAQSRPSMGSTQLFIIGDAETLVPQESSPEAANSLLKLLEEPPDGTRFILTSSEPGRVLSTIRSRCLPIHLSALPTDDVAAFLREHRGVDEPTSRRAAVLGQGSIGRALGFLSDDGDDGPLEELRKQALDLVRAAAAGPGAGFTAALGFRPAGARGLLELFAFVEEWLRDLTAVAAGARERVVHRDYVRELDRLAAGVDPAAAASVLEEVEEAREQARGNVNPQLIVGGLVARLRRRLRESDSASVAVGAGSRS